MFQTEPEDVEEVFTADKHSEVVNSRMNSETFAEMLNFEDST